MSKAKTRTTPADGWRQHQLRRRAAGKGKHPLPAGRYTPVKRKLSGEVVARGLPRAYSVALEELCVLSACTDGFCYTPAMQRAVDAVADAIGPAARADYLARASKREPLQLLA